MSESYSRPFDIRRILNENHDKQPTVSHASPAGCGVDSAIDAALRTVPLPDGLLTRLSTVIYTVPDESPDQVDWLGC